MGVPVWRSAPELAPASSYCGLFYSVIERHEFCKTHREPASPRELCEAREEMSGSTALTLSRASAVRGPTNLNPLWILRVLGLGSIVLSICIPRVALVHQLDTFLSIDSGPNTNVGAWNIAQRSLPSGSFHLMGCVHFFLLVFLAP